MKHKSKGKNLKIFKKEGGKEAIIYQCGQSQVFQLFLSVFWSVC